MNDLRGRTNRPDRTGVCLSPLTFGTMRLDRVGTVDEAARLILAAIDMGVTTFHASREYPTWPLFVEAWRCANPDSDKVQLIAKVGIPHFGEDAFDTAAFTAKIDGYRNALSLDFVAVVQWLLRHDLKQEDARKAIFDRDADLIGETVTLLKGEGRIGSVLSFPYTAGIAERALKADWCDGLAVYCNALELEMVEQMDAASRSGKSVVAIRPFAAGRLFSDTSMTVADAIALPLSHPAVATVVASISSVDRLHDAVTIAQQVQSGSAGWARALDTARGLANA
jgi:aryl-alcohol dehydrogenase-like predicted oxidoreductase